MVTKVALLMYSDYGDDLVCGIFTSVGAAKASFTKKMTWEYRKGTQEWHGRDWNDDLYTIQMMELLGE